MKFLKTNKNKMVLKKLNKEYRKFISSSLNLAPQKSKFGIVYTLYSDRFNSIEVGFAENDKILKNKLLHSDLILLDKKKGKKQDLNLLIKTLNELEISFSSKLNFRYSNILIRHLSTLGWPVGRSLYKHRRIKKELSFA
ncbi:LEM domain-containing protein [uncultured Prochlorococcus sp.]|uniref:LEM domain-containing protein n=1 Tax=uncultured Prochlorococcus sp. TaxID=159733 RepID=UPI0032B1CE4C